MKKAVLPLLAFMLILGCAPDEATKARIATLETRSAANEAVCEKLFSDTNQRLAALEAWAASQSEATTKINSTIFDIQMKLLSKVETEESAVMDPTDKGYSIARNEYGTFPVFIEDAQPYLDGYKIKFRIGNLTSATMTGVSLTIVYGVRAPSVPVDNPDVKKEEKIKQWQEYSEKLDENIKKRKTLKIDVEKDLNPSSWSYIDVTIAPSKAEELGRIEVKLNFSGIKLLSTK